MKKILSLLAVMLVFMLIPMAAFAESFRYIDDGAEMFSAEICEQIEKAAMELESEYGASVYVYTRDDHTDDLAAYTYELYCDLGFETESNRDIVLFLFEESEEYWAIQGLGIQHKMTDDLLSKYLDEYFVPDYDKGLDDAAILSFIEGIGKFYRETYAESMSIKHPEPMQNGQFVTANRGGCGLSCLSCVGLSCLSCAGCGSGGSLFGFVIILIIVASISSIFRGFSRPRFGGGFYRRPRGMHFGGFHRPMGRPMGGIHRPGGFGGSRPGGSFGGSRGSGSRVSGPRGAGGSRGGRGAGR